MSAPASALTVRFLLLGGALLTVPMWRDLLSAAPGSPQAYLTAFGVALSAAILGDVALRLGGFIGAPVTPQFVGGVVTSLPFVLFVAWVGQEVGSDRIPPDRGPRIALWWLLGAAFFAGFFGLVAAVLFETVPNRVGVVRWGIAVGGGGSCLIGWFEARAIERAVEAERSAVRAEELQRRQELLDYLNGLLRHEVLNTANIVQGYAELLEEHSDSQGTVYAQKVGRRTDELTEVISDVRVLLHSSDGDPDLDAIHLRPVVESELTALSDRHPEIETDLDFPDGEVVQADDLLGRLFSNLFENAVEHNDSDTPRVTVRAEEPAPGAETMTIEVADNGVGVPEGKRETLFERTNTRTSSHGLGLSIVATLVDRYGGSVVLRDTGEGGSVFAVTLQRVSDPVSFSEATRSGNGEATPEPLTDSNR